LIKRVVCATEMLLETPPLSEPILGHARSEPRLSLLLAAPILVAGRYGESLVDNKDNGEVSKLKWLNSHCCENQKTLGEILPIKNRNCEKFIIVTQPKETYYAITFRMYFYQKLLFYLNICKLTNNKLRT
jgi:hypothetical protein